MAYICPAAADRVFGPVVAGECRGGFDFTLLFEQSILTILPAGLFLLAFAARAIYLSRVNVKAIQCPLRWLKLGASLVFLALQLTQIVLWSHNTPWITHTSIPEAAINLIIAMQFVFLSWIEDARSVKPSFLLCVYLLFTTLFDVAQARTLWLRQDQKDVASLFTASIATKVALLVLETQQKRKQDLKEEYRRLPPESTAGIIQHSLLAWVFPVFRQGYRALLNSDDVFELRDDMKADALAEKLRSTWNARRRPERRLEFVWALLRATWLPNLKIAFPTLCNTAFNFSQAFLISSLLSLISQPDDGLSASKGYGLIGATALIYLGRAISSLHASLSMSRVSVMSLAATVSLVYDRSLEIHQGVYDDAAAVTLMSTDATRAASAFSTVLDLCIRIIEVGLGLFLLARQVGWICVVPLLTVLGCGYLATLVGKSMHGHQKEWVGAIQKRIAVTASTLSEMRSVKMMGLSNLMETTIQNLRLREIEFMKGIRWDIVWRNVVANSPFSLAAPLTLAAYAIQASIRGQPSFDIVQAFTSLSIIGLLTAPAATLLQTIPSLGQMLGSLDRIQKFLVADARRDTRKTINLQNDTDAEEKGGSMGPNNFEVTPRDQHKSQDAGEEELKGADIAIKGQDLAIRPAPSADIALRDVCFTVPRASLTMVIGSVAAGKSTLLRAILGETVCETGSVAVADRRIAFCDETAWLPNTTVRMAICGHVSRHEIDESWYHTCLVACSLQPDIEQLPDGDATQIGSGSTTLSGGQKHRVALARALYTRPRIILLDNVLSALDTNTKRHIMEQLLGPRGLLRTLGTTTVMATHATEYLSYADRILVLSKGRLEYEGSYDNAVLQGAIPSIGSNIKEVKDDKQEKQQSAKKKAGQTVKPGQREDLTRQTGDLEVYSYYFKFIGWGLSLFYLVFVFIEVGSTTFSQLWVKQWAEAGGGELPKYLTVYLVLPFSTLLGIGGFIWCFLIKISPVTARKLHYVLLRTVIRAPASFFSHTDTGTIINRFSQDMTLVESDLATGTALTVSMIFRVAVAVALVCVGSTYMAITVPFLMVAIYLLQHVYLRTSRQIRLISLEAKGPLYTHFLETLGGISTIRAFDWQEDSRTENHRLLDASQRPGYLFSCIQCWLNLILSLIVTAEAILVVGLAVGLRHSTSPGLLGISLNNILNLSSLLSSLVSYFVMFETSLGSIARIKNFERDVQPEDKERENTTPPPTWPDAGSIEFKNVTASHDPNSVALREISFKIEAGAKVGICGRTGSGKSSLVASILRLLELDHGAIIIDNLDLSTLPRESIRSQLVTLPQDPLILAGTARHNTDPHGSASEESVISALSCVGLWDALQQRGGLDTDITGGALSKGQQQLLALARAVLQMRRDQAKVLILDEPTSNVDAETEAIVHRVVREEFASCTVLTVAHRLGSMMESDAIIVLEEGRLVEFGNPEELVAKNGWFAKLVQG